MTKEMEETAKAVQEVAKTCLPVPSSTASRRAKDGREVNIADDNISKGSEAELKATTNCVHCSQEIPSKARVCHHCHLPQNKPLYYLFEFIKLTSVIIVFVAIAQVILAYIQVNEAKKKRIEASVALSNATEALFVANKASITASNTVDYLNDFISTNQVTINNIKHDLSGVNSNIIQANEGLADVKIQQHLVFLGAKAQAYDSDAFFKLMKLSSETNDAGKYAGHIVDNIKWQLIANRLGSIITVIREEYKGYSYEGPYTTDEIAMYLRKQSHLWAVDAANTDNIILLIPTIVELVQKENNLLNANRMTYAISKMTGQDFNPWNMDSLNEWWSGHKTLFTNWRYADYEIGTACYYRLKYKDAIPHFERILAVDPNADYVRALAICCALSSGDTSIVSNLTSFKNPNGRWAKWAHINQELSTGNVQSATMQFVELATNYPTIIWRASFHRATTVYHKVDWNLYDEKLKAAGYGKLTDN